MQEGIFVFDYYQVAAVQTSRFSRSIEQMLNDVIPPGIAPEAHAKIHDVLGLAYCGLGLGESGEVQGNIKKLIRDDNGVLTPERTEKIIDELGDVLWYIANVAEIMGIPLHQIATRNIEKLQSRVNRGTLHGSGDNR